MSSFDLEIKLKQASNQLLANSLKMMEANKNRSIKISHSLPIPVLLFFLLLLFVTTTTVQCSDNTMTMMMMMKKKKSSRTSPTLEPCYTLTVYFHDILYNGENAGNATSAIVGGPAWSDPKRTKLSPFMHFGDVVVFDDPITLDNNLRSPAVGQAQGMYLYDKKEVYTAWLSFSLVFNSTQHRGTLNLVGADPLMNKTRDVSVVGGTGDFMMARRIATLMTDAFEGEVYFRLRVDVKLYDCY